MGSFGVVGERRVELNASANGDDFARAVHLGSSVVPTRIRSAHFCDKIKEAGIHGLKGGW